MKYKKIDISNELITDVLINGISAIPVSKVPSDLKVIKCLNAWPNKITLIIESEEFEDIGEGYEYPNFDIMFKNND